jgi:hypothetical protein
MNSKKKRTLSSFASYFFPSKDVILSSPLLIDLILLSLLSAASRHGLFFSLFYDRRPPVTLAMNELQ